MKTEIQGKTPDGSPALAPVSCSAASVLSRIQSYFSNGGLFNPEMMEHDKVSDLIYECREEILELTKYKQRMDWLHASGPNDSDGCEWGIYRVKWENGRAVEVWQTLSDFSDLDAEMEKQQNDQAHRPPTPDV